MNKNKNSIKLPIYQTTLLFCINMYIRMALFTIMHHQGTRFGMPLLNEQTQQIY